jgi:hypothetical protein
MTCLACGCARGQGCGRDDKEPRVGCYILGGPVELVESRTASSVSQAPNIPAPANRPTSALRRSPQSILSEFEAAREKATRVADLAKGRPVVGIAACVAKLVSAERQRCVHILAAADAALKELGD